jgi:hypothetical protein
MRGKAGNGRRVHLFVFRCRFNRHRSIRNGKQLDACASAT